MCSGEQFRVEEYYSGWSKSSICADLKHILKAIILGYANAIVWPGPAERVQLAGATPGIFNGVIGVMDITEMHVQRPKNATAEAEAWSTKKHAHTIKTLSVMNMRGMVIYIMTGWGGVHSDREMWTESSLYLERDRFFTADEKVAADGGFRGNGPLIYSWDNPGNDPAKQAFNVAFNEVRKYKENNYGRVKSSFPILGRARLRFDSSAEIKILTIHAAFRLHHARSRSRLQPAGQPRPAFREIF